ncbi:hypothetical protein [Couchioplanes caeruleus]|uniref:hypothetical protein n=1 Tax=Couchioplanes caeruleus TaxID=56438 RepID=UPI0011CD4D28|nr:hypothetical protein [Couchioplanes caeruleus]
MRKTVRNAVVNVGFVLAVASGAVATISTLTTHPTKATTVANVQADSALAPAPTPTTFSEDSTIWG